MRFGLVHRLFTDALALLGVLALVVSGQFASELSLVTLVVLVVAVSLRESWRQRASERHVDFGLTALLIVVQLGRGLVTKASVLDLIIEFAVGLQIIRVATRNGAAHDQQIIVLALLHLIAGTVVGGGLGYGLCFVGVMVVAPGALVLSHLRREVEGNYRQGARDRTGLPVDVPRILRSKRVVGKQLLLVTGLLSVPILIFTSVLFLIFPRVGLSLLLLSRPRTERVIGFSNRVDLGQIGTLRSDPTIALRVRIKNPQGPPPPRLAMHLRGTALDHYDGRAWSQSLETSHTIAQAGELVPLRNAGRENEHIWKVELEAFEPPVLFLPPHTRAVRLARPGTLTTGNGLSLASGPEGELRYQAGGERGVHYDLHIADAAEPTFTRLRPNERPRYQALPRDLPARIGELAASWVAGKTTDLERAQTIAHNLRSDYGYDLNSPSGASPQPLDDFLFVSRRGHCEFFSTALAVMLRTLDIPTRAVTGFVGGTYNKYGEFYAVRQGDAHSWVEVFIDGKGWLTLDATPPGSAMPQSAIEGTLAGLRDFFEAASQRWDHHVLGYDLDQQAGLLDAVRPHAWPVTRLLDAPKKRVFGVSLGVAVAMLSAYYLLKRKRAQKKAEAGKQDEPEHAATAARLYRMLDRAMASAGIGRAASLPPLRHALSLAEGGHPHSADVLGLTERYLAARFGESPLTAGEQRNFESGVKRIVALAADGRRRRARDSMRKIAAVLTTRRSAHAAAPNDDVASPRPSRWPASSEHGSVETSSAHDHELLAVAPFDDATDSFRGHPAPPRAANDGD
ncbi:MAG: DUF3488 domain-containing protein [Myxococcales bacterium]|nr:DUF3488 domain-containing protein [Myxococcales bacterium]